MPKEMIVYDHENMIVINYIPNKVTNKNTLYDSPNTWLYLLTSVYMLYEQNLLHGNINPDEIITYNGYDNYPLIKFHVTVDPLTICTMDKSIYRPFEVFFLQQRRRKQNAKDIINKFIELFSFAPKNFTKILRKECEESLLTLTNLSEEEIIKISWKTWDLYSVSICIMFPKCSTFVSDILPLSNIHPNPLKRNIPTKEVVIQFII
ncbi:hypothetical protein EBX93_17075 [bacterium]|nr:hypothetical protein [bacterium]